MSCSKNCLLDRIHVLSMYFSISSLHLAPPNQLMFTSTTTISWLCLCLFGEKGEGEWEKSEDLHYWDSFYCSPHHTMVWMDSCFYPNTTRPCDVHTDFGFNFVFKLPSQTTKVLSNSARQTTRFVNMSMYLSVTDICIQSTIWTFIIYLFLAIYIRIL